MKDAAKGAIIGASSGVVGGAVIGLGIGKAGQYMKGTELKNYKSLDNMTKEERKEFRKIAKEYYQDYLQGTNVNHRKFGKIDFTAKGCNETFNKNINMAKDFPDLKNNIKNAKYKKSEDLYKSRKDHFNKFHTFESKDGKKYIIATDENGNRYYLTKEK